MTNAAGLMHINRYMYWSDAPFPNETLLIYNRNGFTKYNRHQLKLLKKKIVSKRVNPQKSFEKKKMEFPLK